MRTVEEIRGDVARGVAKYNSLARHDRRIVRVELFGSYADGRQTDASDIDLLVEFADEHVSLFNLAAALEALEQATGMPVDLVQAPLPDDALIEVGRTVPLYDAA